MQHGHPATVGVTTVTAAFVAGVAAPLLSALLSTFVVDRSVVDATHDPNALIAFHVRALAFLNQPEILLVIGVLMSLATIRDLRRRRLTSGSVGTSFVAGACLSSLAFLMVRA